MKKGLIDFVVQLYLIYFFYSVRTFVKKQWSQKVVFTAMPFCVPQRICQ